MVILSIILAIIFLCLVCRFPKCMIYTMLGLSVFMLVGGIVVGIIAKQYVISIICLIFLAFFGCFICCFKDRI